MTIGKTLRFEVFARDGFTCQYCGQRPPDVVLELDHIHPVSKGGPDDVLNLITACFDCNRGKRDKVISEVAPRPDADLMFLKVQQEIAEVERFLKEQKKLDTVSKKLCNSLRKSWSEKLTTKPLPSDRILCPWIKRYGPEEIITSMNSAIPAYMNDKFGSYDSDVFKPLILYIGAILRNRANGVDGRGERVVPNGNH